MRKISRLANICRVFARHRLDTFLDRSMLPWAFRLLLAPARLYPQPTEPRGVRLRMAFEELGPVFIKFGQLLSTRPDMIPVDIVTELDNLQDNVPPFDSDEFTRIVETTLNGAIDDLFLEFDHNSLASASVAQVHAAVLKDGREVVVKAIRPGIEKVIQQDLSLLFTLAKLLERVSADARRLHPVQVVADYRQTIFDELDLRREAANTSILRRNFENSPLLYIPDVYWPYTNERMMVTERIYATPITEMEVLRRQNTDIKLLAERGVEIFFTQVFDHNFFHADMHPGNIFVDISDPADPKYLAVDCAIIGSLSQHDQYYVARNLLAIFRRDYQQVAELYVHSGWLPEDTPIAEFASAIRTVCEPVFERPLKDISFGLLLVQLFRTARRFNMEVQPSLVLLQKTLLNVEGLGRQLYPELDLWSTAHPFLERWLRKRYRPGKMLGQLIRHGPEWLEQFPQVPQMVFHALEQLQRPDVDARHHRPRNKQLKSKKGNLGQRLLGFVCLGVGLGIGFPHWMDGAQQVPAGGLILTVTGLALLLR